MILLKANPKLKNVFSKLIKTMNVTVTWNDIFVIVNNNLILAGDVRSLIFSFDNRKIYTNILEIPLGSKHIESMPDDGMLENIINMSLYAFGKWGSIGALKVDKDYSALNALFESILQPVNIESAFNAENFRFYKGGIQITYEDTILEILRLLKSEGRLKEGQNLITSGAREQEKDTDMSDGLNDDTSDTGKRTRSDMEDDEYTSEIGIWHNLIWKKENCVFEKHSGNDDITAKSRIGNDFYITDNLCPKCKKKMYMAMYPSGKELLIDTEEGRVFMARTYTCYNCHSFYTPRPKRLLQEGDVYSLKFDEDKTAYDDYLSVLGATAERTANYKFNEFESERNSQNEGGSNAGSSYINEFNRGVAPVRTESESAGSETADVNEAWKKVQEERELKEKERRERERIEREQERQEQLEQERAEQERLEREKIERIQAEQERLKRERMEWEQAEEERLERERIEKERRELARIESLQAERERLEQERLAWERDEQIRLEREKAERERLEQERLERERIERERLEMERQAWERAKQEKIEREKAEKERLERERIEREQAEKERIAHEKAERERLEREKIEWEKAEKERLEREKAEREKAEKERLEREKAEREQAERERLKHEEAERLRKEQEKLAIRQEILLLSGKTTDELRLILSNSANKDKSHTGDNAGAGEDDYLTAVKETLRTKMNAKYTARMGTLGKLSFRQLSDLMKQIEGEEVLRQNEKDEYTKEIETYLNKAEAEILDQKIELSRNKTYAEIERIMEEVSKRNCDGDIKQGALEKLTQIKAERARIEVEDLIAHIPLHLDRKQLAVYFDKIDKYEGVDITPYSDILAQKANMAEEEEISTMMKRGGKKDRAALWSLYEELKSRDYKEENKAPYLEKIYDKVREMDEEQIDQLCPSIVRLSFEEGLKVYAQIEQGMFLPEIKTDALEMVKRRLTKLKTDESVQLMRKLKLSMEESMPDCDSLYFYDAREEMKKHQNTEGGHEMRDIQSMDFNETDKEPANNNEYRVSMMNAIDSYASLRDDYEYPLMVCDASRSRNGKDGFVITPDHIFYHTLLNSGRINIPDITEIKAGKGFFSKGVYVKYAGGNKEKLPNCISRENQDAFAKVLNDFVSYLHDKPESRSLEYMAKESHDVKCCYRCGHVYTEGDVCPKCGSRMNK